MSLCLYLTTFSVSLSKKCMSNITVTRCCNRCENLFFLEGWVCPSVLSGQRFRECQQYKRDYEQRLYSDTLLQRD